MNALSNIQISGLLYFLPLVFSLVAILISLWNTWNHANSIAVSSFLEMTNKMQQIGRRMWEVTQLDDSQISDVNLANIKEKVDHEMTQYIDFIDDYCLLVNRKKINSFIRKEVIHLLKKLIVYTLKDESLHKYFGEVKITDDDGLKEIKLFCINNSISGFPELPMEPS